MFGALAGALHAGLSLWASKEANKYRDRLMQLERDWYEVFNLPDEQRDDSRLDSIEHELCVLASGWSAAVGGENPPAQP